MELDQGRRVLVTGAGGFIGGHLVAALLQRGFTDIRAVDLKPLGRWYQEHEGVDNVSADLREKDACYSAVEGVTYVFNLAADMGGMGFIETHKADCMVSVLINTNLLLASRDHGIEHFLFGSSACVYAAGKQTDPNVTALKEEDAYPAMPEDGYGWEKLFSERMCRHFMEDYGIAVRVPRFHNVYGPYGTYAGGREKAPAAVCRKVIEAQLNQTGAIEIWGDGEQTRSFTYIDDTIEGLFRIMESEFSEPINLGSSQLVTINGLVDIVEGIADVKLERNYNLSAPQGVRGRNSDNALIRAQLGWEPSISLEDGLEKTYHWIYEQMTSGRTDEAALAFQGT
ncbi:MAG TPA: NAD-dependent epimerase/dehydratase family protein [Gaiellaceae bacterium]|nr:NAD-dependent epimerase/dehydratase family protein [Gaiellaceae bacterium]